VPFSVNTYVGGGRRRQHVGGKLQRSFGVRALHTHDRLLTDVYTATNVALSRKCG
jgi:hypothetical protein